MKKILRKILDSEYAIGLLLLLLVIFAIIFCPDFFSVQNFSNILNRTSTIAIAAIGMTYVIIGGGIDLSVGGILILVAYIGVGKFINTMGLSVELSILLMMMLGAFLGLLNGLSVVYLKMPSFIATLAMLSITRGLSLYMFKAVTLFGFSKKYLFLGQSKLLGVPMSIIVFLGLAIIGEYILRYTIFGRSIYALGNNKKAAWLTGVNIDRAAVSTFVISGLTAGIAGIVLSSRMEAVTGNMGTGLELDVIAAVVIGGCSLMGGEGSVIGAIIGGIIISVFGNILVLLRLSPFIQEFSKGLLLWVAILIDMARRGYIGKKEI